MNSQVSVDREKLAAFCRANGIFKLSIFGSALREDCRPDSDIDVLVEFSPDCVPGLFAYADMELSLKPVRGSLWTGVRSQSRRLATLGEHDRPRSAHLGHQR